MLKYYGWWCHNPGRVPIAVRLHNYMIFINNSNLFLIHLGLILPPLLITKLYTLLLPPAHGCHWSLTPLLCHHNAKYRTCRNVLGHTVVTAGDIPPNHIKICVWKCLANWGVLPLYVLAPRHTVINWLRHPIMKSPQCAQNTGCYDRRVRYYFWHILYHRHIETPRCPGATSLSSQQVE